MQSNFSIANRCIDLGNYPLVSRVEKNILIDLRSEKRQLTFRNYLSSVLSYFFFTLRTYYYTVIRLCAAFSYGKTGYGEPILALDATNVFSTFST